MADTANVVINLPTGLEDAERVTVGLLIGGAAVERRKQVTWIGDDGATVFSY
jgi:hypothetical protein